MKETKKRTVSTGQAALLCSVKPDTILKWVTSGKIKAARTAGGHYRIHKESLAAYMSDTNSPVADLENEKLKYCWEICSGGQEIKKECLKCIVFISKAQNCYLLASLGKSGGHSGVYCGIGCDNCEFYKYIRKLSCKILLISSGNDLLTDLENIATCDMAVKCAVSGYAASALIENFHPDTIFVDEALKGEDPMELCRQLSLDNRIKGSKIYLITEENRGDLQKISSIQHPFPAAISS